MHNSSDGVATLQRVPEGLEANITCHADYLIVSQRGSKESEDLAELTRTSSDIICFPDFDRFERARGRDISSVHRLLTDLEL